MEIQRHRIIAVGAQSPEMLSKVTEQLSLFNYEIESISSLRLGHSFIIVILVEAVQDKHSIENCLKKVVDTYDIKLIIDSCVREKFDFIKSDAFMRIRGKQMTGVKSYVISEFTNAGLDIHGLESDTYELDSHEETSVERFIINIKGQALNGIEDLNVIANKLQKQDMDVAIANNWKLLA
jgi:acetolactate synthase small subunit